jgi:hypothetical protein
MRIIANVGLRKLESKEKANQRGSPTQGIN